MDKPQIYINDLATRSFRNVADQDYIAARACYRSGLMIQFLWLSQQAFEKYLKAILLYNRKSSKKLGHNLLKALDSVREIKDLALDLSDPFLHFLKYVNSQGSNRYLERIHFTRGGELLELDRAVWQIRRYCKYINRTITLPNGSKKNLMKLELEAIHQWLDSDTPHKHKITGGLLEKVIAKKRHPQRENLIWQNIYYGKNKRKKVTVPRMANTIYPTHILHPEYFSEYERVVQFSPEIRDHFKKK